MLFTYEVLKTQLKAQSWNLFCEAAASKTDIMKQMYERTMKSELASNSVDSKYMVKVCTRALTYYNLNRQDSIRKNILDAIQELANHTGKELGFIDARGTPWMMIPFDDNSPEAFMELHNLDIPEDSDDFRWGDIFQNQDGSISVQNLKTGNEIELTKEDCENNIKKLFDIDESIPQYHYFCAVARNYLLLKQKWI